MNNFSRKYFIIGVVVLTIVAIILMLSPGTLLSPMVTLGTSLNTMSSNSISVQSKEDLSNPTVMSNFPKIIGTWQGYDYPVETYIAELQADAMLVRVYEPPTFSQPLFFNIVVSKTDSSFHSPSGCFISAGYQIQAEAQENVTITDTSWIVNQSKVIVPLDELVVTKNNADGTINERRLVLFFYVKGNPFYTDSITMIEVDAVIPLQGSYDEFLNEEKGFLNQAIPLMFSQPSTENDYHPIFLTLVDWGVGGDAVIAILIIIPLTIIFYSFVKRRLTPKS